eukprot:TRINITY_DN10336_c0_g1_i1.p1 TRINITY_DN10336_c0_g1~~TRINITY_DN10336_c0_g1_i1.p1  ORF type:complete len:791 (+),score=141.09 TRINITY_DN10336_c0_g1_i1:57-2429(+)
MRLLFLLMLVPHAAGASFQDHVNKANADGTPWFEIPTSDSTVPQRRTPGVCQMSDHLYLFAGLGVSGKMRNDLWQLNLNDLVWTELSPNIDNVTGTPTPYQMEEAHMVCGGAQNAIYVMNDEGLWKFTLGTNTWLKMPTDLVNGLHPSMKMGYHPILTRNHIVFTGSGSISSRYPVFNTKTDLWEPVARDSRLNREDPSGIANGDIAIVTGGARSSTLVDKTLFINLTDSERRWDELTLSGLAAEEFYTASLSDDIMAARGSPVGKGSISTSYGISLLQYSIARSPEFNQWVAINQTSNWAPLAAYFVVTSYNGSLIQVGGVEQKNLTLMSKIFAYNYRICPQHCNHRGVCLLGNCVQCSGSTGAACETLDPPGTDHLPFIIGPVAGGVFLLVLLLGVSWKMTEKSRRLRSLYDTSNVAAKMAEQIARMELEELEYLGGIENPTGIQRSFISIIKVLNTYRMYLPASVLQTMQSDSEQETECTGLAGEPRAHTHISSRASSVHSGSSTNNQSESTATRGNVVASLQTDLAVKVVKKTVATCAFRLSGFEKWVAEATSTGQIHSTIKTFTDTVQSMLETHRGTLLSAQLSHGMIVGAWNFTIPKSTPDVSACEAALATMHHLPESFPLKMQISTTGGSCWAGNLGGTHLRVPALVGTLIEKSNILIDMASVKKLPITTDLVGTMTWFRLLPVDIISHKAAVNRKGDVSTPVEEMKCIHVYQLIAKLEGNEGEWMYALHDREIGSSATASAMDVYSRDGARAARAFIDALDSAKAAELQLLRDSLEEVDKSD